MVPVPFVCIVEQYGIPGNQHGIPAILQATGLYLQYNIFHFIYTYCLPVRNLMVMACVVRPFHALTTFRSIFTTFKSTPMVL
jgi:hypothetical protein